jgi:hypothetical protein
MNNNPLKQYFRRPSVYLKLPSKGVGYPPGALNLPDNGEVAVYPMTAIDEITTKTPDALFNGTAVAELIKSCIPDIIDPWSVTSEDLDSILIAIKAASGGNDFEVMSTCPKCSNEGTYGINLVAVLATMRAPDYSKLLELGDLQIKFKPLTYREINQAGIEQLEVQKLFAMIDNEENEDKKVKLGEQALKGITDLTMRIVTKAIEYVQTPNSVVTEKDFILDFMKNCDKNTYTKIRDFNTELKVQTEIKPLEIKCVECGNEYKQQFTLNPSDFFA